MFRQRQFQHIYTSQFFWDTRTLTIWDRRAVRLALMMIPTVLFIVNWMFWRTFEHQCRSMYLVFTVVDKIGEKLGLRTERKKERENYCYDKLYIPDVWDKKHGTSVDYVNLCMCDDRLIYKRLLLLFQLFGALAISIIVIEIAMLIIHP